MDRSFNRPWRDDNEKRPSTYGRQRLRAPSVLATGVKQGFSSGGERNDLAQSLEILEEFDEEFDVRPMSQSLEFNANRSRPGARRTYSAEQRPQQQNKFTGSDNFKSEPFQKPEKQSKSLRREGKHLRKSGKDAMDGSSRDRDRKSRSEDGKERSRSKRSKSPKGSKKSPKRSNSERSQSPKTSSRSPRRAERTVGSARGLVASSSSRLKPVPRLGVSDESVSSAVGETPDIERQRQQSVLQPRDGDVSTAAKTLRNLNIDVSGIKRPTASAVEVGSNRTSSASETSRELRTRRLLEQQRERRKASMEQSSQQSPSPNQEQHFTAHAPAVEKYLSKKHMIENIQARSDLGRSSGTLDSTQSSLPAESSGRAPRDFLKSARSRPVIPKAPSSGIPRAPSSGNGSPANIVKLDPKPLDETSRTLDSAVSGWSTFNSRLRRAVSPAKDKQSKVDQYLANRKQQPATDGTNQFIRVPSYDTDALLDDIDRSSNSSVDQEDPYIDDYLESSDDQGAGHSNDYWSVRVCIISAVDLPASVVPNLPLSPVLKLGLLPIPDASDEITTRRQLSEKIDGEGLYSVPSAKIRCTSPKILSQRENGSTEFQEEIRWNRVRMPYHKALAVELASRAVLAPANSRESPKYDKNATQDQSKSANLGAQQTRFAGMFRKSQKKGTKTELEQANAAAAVAKILVEEDDSGIQTEREGSNESKLPRHGSVGASTSQSEYSVLLVPSSRRKHTTMTNDLRLGSKVIPLDTLDVEQAKDQGFVRLEQWFELDSNLGSASTSRFGRQTSSNKRNPSILLEITFAREEVLDDSEDEMDPEDLENSSMQKSYSKRASLMVKNQLKRETPVTEKKALDEPVLDPGIVDFACLMGARDIGDQKADDGSRGWVNTRPECVILERFPQNDSFHHDRGRKVSLAEKIEWFCFPEGVRLWRGATPPNAEEMNLKRFSASSPSSMSSSTALFDAYLGCTTSFSWFVIASNSDEYGSELVKTYGAVIRFYVPAPVGIDPKQDDFTQFETEEETQQHDLTERKRLWVPMAMCLISNLPIVGAMETMLLRLCDAMSLSGIPSHPLSSQVLKNLANIVLNYQKPIRGVVDVSVPFLSGEPLQISIPPKQGLPALPHGSAVSSVCRLLGSEGLVNLLAALLTESKVLMHSDDVANLCVVAEVMTTLLYPFQWSLPYVPVLPAAMMEFIEAPMPYLLGIPTCNLKYVDPFALEDVVVVDLNRDSSEMPDGGSSDNSRTKAPPSLPASASSNIARAVNEVLRVEEEAEEAMGDKRMSGAKMFPRMEAESTVEKEFRLKVALELCGLTLGLEDCLVYASSSQPVFNADKFLQTAPAIFEEQRGRTSLLSRGEPLTQKVISPRSRKFMSAFVNCQHFHQFLEMVNEHHLVLFHEIMDILKTGNKPISKDHEVDVSELMKTLKKLEDRVPTYHIPRIDEGADQHMVPGKGFPFNLLQMVNTSSKSGAGKEGAGGVKSVSVEILVELEKNPWRFQSCLSIDTEDKRIVEKLVVGEKLNLRDAIGERRFRAWQMAKEDDDFGLLADEGGAFGGSEVLDLSSLLGSVDSKVADTSSLSAEEQRKQAIEDARCRDTIRRCLQLARFSGGLSDDEDEDLTAEAEAAVRNVSARHFFLSILGQRKDPQSSHKAERGTRRRSHVFNTVSLSSKLEVEGFNVLVRLGCAVLDVCMEHQDFEMAAALLKLTAGLYTFIEGKLSQERAVLYLTGRIGRHPAYAELGVWETVRRSHLKSRKQALEEVKSESDEKDDPDKDDYESAITTLYEMVAYGIPAEQLAHFAFATSKNMEWFGGDKGQSLLMLAKRLCVRRQQGENTSSGTEISDADVLGLVGGSFVAQQSPTPPKESQWFETGWCHPAAKSARRHAAVESKRQGTQNILNMVDEHHNHKHEKRMKRSAITTMAYLGSSVVATGGLDGGVFLARRVRNEQPHSDKDLGVGSAWDDCGVRGLHLDWGSSGSRFSSVGSSATGTDGEYGVGGVSCLAATYTANNPYFSEAGSRSKDTCEPLDEGDLLKAMDGCRVVAGTTCGDLRVWSIKDVFSAVFYGRTGDLSSSVYSGKAKSGSEFVAGSSLTRLKFSLRGRALSGHRGGVSCVDVPSPWYRPDSIISGGADGLIKIWSLRAPTISGIGQRTKETNPKKIMQSPVSSNSQATKAARSGDALSILSGHGGRILHVKTAWHGDRMLSCGADRTVRVWDLSGTGGRCLNTLSGHFGWVTKVDYWGPNTIMSASTDRSVALWDTRIRPSPLFALRHHQAPISDLLAGSRTDPWLVTAGLDGIVAVWDFRQLSASGKSRPTLSNKEKGQCKVVRDPIARMSIRDHARYRHSPGTVHLSRAAVYEGGKSVYCLGADATIREMDVGTGRIVSEHITGHADAISSFCSSDSSHVGDSFLVGSGTSKALSTITASWDGTVRFRYRQ